MPLRHVIASTAYVTVHSLEVIEWRGQVHTFPWPAKSFSEAEKKAMQAALEGANEPVSLQDDPESDVDDKLPTAFVLKMRVLGGTYARSIVHDLAHAIGSAGHVATLTRSCQWCFVLEKPGEEEDRTCVPWEVFEAASAGYCEVDEEGWTKWENEVIERLEIAGGQPLVNVYAVTIHNPLRAPIAALRHMPLERFRPMHNEEL